MQKMFKRWLLRILLFFEILWTLNLLSIWLDPQVTEFNFERTYYTASPWVDIPAIRGTAIDADEALTLAQMATWPYVLVSIVAIILVSLSLKYFSTRIARRTLWLASALIMVYLLVWLNIA